MTRDELLELRGLLQGIHRAIFDDTVTFGAVKPNLKKAMEIVDECESRA